MGVKDYLRGIFNVGEDDEFERETFENEPTKAGKIKTFPSVVSPYASNWRSRIGH